jgi:activator of 2-hydroxyglutaryl-CoA dehydratase
MADANEQTTEQTTQQTDAAADLIPRAEAQKAFQARDKAKKELDALRARALSEEDIAEFQRLKEQSAKAEEDRLKKAGEYDNLRQTLTQKHAAEIEAERKARLELETSYRAEKIEAAFLGASDWFGGDTAKTIMTGDMAYAYLGKHVAYEDVDVAGRTIKAVVVRDTDGNIILDGKGNPAKFSAAIGELIDQLPNKDRILRGSGKTGSGSSGGSRDIGGAVVVDVRQTQSRGAFSDPKQRAAMKKQMAGAGGLQMGPAWDRTNQ